MATIQTPYPDYEFFFAHKDCENPQPKCPREDGEDYTKCQTVCRQAGHAEIQAMGRTCSSPSSAAAGPTPISTGTGISMSSWRRAAADRSSSATTSS